MKTIGPIEVGEIKAVRFDFSGEITDSNAALTLPSVAISVLDGVDPTPTSALIAPAYIDGTDVVQLVQASNVGVTYKLRAWLTEGGQLRHGIPTKLAVVPA